jgi:hypothetical protein
MRIVQPKSLLDRGFTVLGLSIFFGKLDQKPEEPKELVRRMRRMLEKPWKFTGFARHITRCFTSDHGGDACHEYNGRKQGARHEKSHGGGCGNHIWANEAASTHNLCLSCFFLMRTELTKHLNWELQQPEYLAYRKKCVELYNSVEKKEERHLMVIATFQVQSTNLQLKLKEYEGKCKPSVHKQVCHDKCAQKVDRLLGKIRGFGGGDDNLNHRINRYCHTQNRLSRELRTFCVMRNEIAKLTNKINKVKCDIKTQRKLHHFDIVRCAVVDPNVRSVNLT